MKPWVAFVALDRKFIVFVRAYNTWQNYYSVICLWFSSTNDFIFTTWCFRFDEFIVYQGKYCHVPHHVYGLHMQLSCMQHRTLVWNKQPLQWTLLIEMGHYHWCDRSNWAFITIWTELSQLKQSFKTFLTIIRI